MLALPLRGLALLCAFLAGTSSTTAQESRILLDSTTDLGNGDFFRSAIFLSINDDGDWLANLGSTSPGSSIVLSSTPLLRVGDLVPGSGGAVFERTRALDLSASGDVNAIIVIRDPQGSFEAGFYRNGRLLFRDGTLVEGVEGLAPGTVWRNFDEVHSAGNRVALLASVDDPSIPTVVNDLLLSLVFDESDRLVSSEILLLEGDALSGTDGSVQQIASTRPAINDRGDWIASGALDVSERVFVAVNGVPVARSGRPSPLVDRVHSGPGRHLDLNAFGEYAYTGAVVPEFDSPFDNTETALFRNAEVIAFEGQLLPSLTPDSVSSISSAAQVRLSDAGDVVWGVRTSRGVGHDAIMRNGEVLLREGVSRVGGQTIESMRLGNSRFDVSPSGRYLIAEVVLDTGPALVRIDYGAVVPLSGCEPNPGRLRRASGEALAGGSLVLEMEGAAAVGTPAFLYLSDAPAATDGCGLLRPFGEVLLGGNRIARLEGGFYLGVPLSFPLELPADPAIVDLDVFAQGVFLDLSGALPGPPVTLTDGLRIEIGAP